jgi:cell division septal protein FtsQ
LGRFFGKIFRPRRRCEHLESRVFRAQKKSVLEKLTLKHKIFIVLVVVALGGIFGFTKLSSFFDVEKVSIARSSLDLPIDAIETSVRELAVGKNIFSVDENALADAVRELRPDIARVAISKKYPREISVEVFKYPIVAEIKTNSESIFVNENGFRVVGDNPDRDTLILTLGESLDFSDPEVRVIDPARLAFIREAVFYFESLADLQVLSVKYFPISQEVHLKNELNFDIWLDFASDFREQLSKLAAAADILRIGEQKFEYIDLRIRGKIFYKLK